MPVSPTCEIGWVKRGRGYGSVTVLSRYQLPKVSAVRYRSPNGREVIEAAECVKAEKPLTARQSQQKAYYANLLALLTTEWQSISAIGQRRMHVSGLWQMCKKLERAGEVEMRSFDVKPGCWREEVRLKGL